jgi:xanthine dehydrogenase molybdopterin-binding subunit B
MGGAIGGKESQGNLPAVLSALAARVTGPSGEDGL